MYTVLYSLENPLKSSFAAFVRSYHIKLLTLSLELFYIPFVPLLETFHITLQSCALLYLLPRLDDS